MIKFLTFFIAGTIFLSGCIENGPYYSPAPQRGGNNGNHGNGNNGHGSGKR